MDTTNLEWYNSTKGPKISLTLKMLAALLLPAAKILFHVTIGSEFIDSLIDSGLVFSFGAFALYGHIRAKQELGARIQSLRAQVINLGGTIK